MVGLQPLVLNICFLICPILLFHSIDIAKRYVKVVIGLFASLSAVLCMTFPFAFYSNLSGSIYDLRYIPFAVASLYGGFRTGLFVMMVSLAYRCTLGGSGFWTSLWIYGCMAGVAFWVAAFYKRNSIRRKMIVAIVLAVFADTVFVSVSLLKISTFGMHTWLPAKFLLECSFIQILGMWTAVWLIETLQSNQLVRHQRYSSGLRSTIGELAATVAHEINNPLTGARGFIQLLNEREISQEKQKQYLQVILNDINGVQSIVNNFLFLANKQVIRPEVLEVLDVTERICYVKGVLSSFANMLHVDLHEMSTESLFILADREKFTQLLLNMMKNRIEVMPCGGVLKIHAHRNRDQVLIDIIDNGVGMTKEELNQLGKPFYSIQYSGTSLGMMISYRIIESMNGTIEVRTSKEEGTQFTLRIPAVS